MTCTKDHGLLFTDAMVRAYLAGHKTQTRRPLRLPRQWGDQVQHQDLEASGFWCCYPGRSTHHWQYGDDRLPQQYHAGDRLWVREAARLSSASGYGGVTDTVRLCYRAANELLSPTHHRQDWSPYAADRWTPSVSMPRWAARLVLPIVSVRAERVRDITEKDALAEGVLHRSCDTYSAMHDDDPRQDFTQLWDSIYGNRYPHETAWCVVIETTPYQEATR